jgi:hypothetical protein
MLVRPRAPHSSPEGLRYVPRLPHGGPAGLRYVPARCVLGVGVLAIVLALGAVACTPDPQPIAFNDGMITVQNLTSTEWRNVLITVNDHYRGGAPSLAAKGRLNAPISQFKTAYGEAYVLARQPVVKIEVTATDANGQPVALLWGERQ